MNHAYNRALSDGEVAGLYQATKSSIGTLRIHKGVGDGTFNAIPVEVDNGLGSKGQVAWGDADGDGDLDILTSGSDSTTPQLQVYLSTQSVSNTAPSAPGTLTGAFAFSTSTVSVASFTWTADRFRHRLNVRKRAELRHPDIDEIRFQPIAGLRPKRARVLGWDCIVKPPEDLQREHRLRGNAEIHRPLECAKRGEFRVAHRHHLLLPGQKQDAGLATSGWSASGMLNTVAAPSTSTIMASTTAVPGTITLSWSSAGDDWGVQQPHGQLSNPVRHVYRHLEHRVHPHQRHDGDDRHNHTNTWLRPEPHDLKPVERGDILLCVVNPKTNHPTGRGYPTAPPP